MRSAYVAATISSTVIKPSPLRSPAMQDETGNSLIDNATIRRISSTVTSKSPSQSPTHTSTSGVAVAVGVGGAVSLALGAALAVAVGDGTCVDEAVAEGTTVGGSGVALGGGGVGLKLSI